MAPFMVFTLVAASCLVRFAEAVPLVASYTRRDVVSPPVTAPNASTVWVVGTTQTIVWDLSNLPEHVTNPQGTVLLGFLNDTTGNEHLMINNPLASDFDIRTGSVDIVVPNVEPRNDYIVALLGDSGNISDRFTIKNSTASSSSATSSMASASEVATSESTLPPQPTETQHGTTSSTAPVPSLATSTQMVSLTLTTQASSVALKGTASQSTALGSSSAFSNSASPTSSAVPTHILSSRLMKLVLPIIIMVLLL